MQPLRRIKNLPGEKWLPINDFPSYQISNKGRIYSFKRYRLLRPNCSNKNYPENVSVELSDKGKKARKTVKRLVIEHFGIKPKKPKPEIAVVYGKVMRRLVLRKIMINWLKGYDEIGGGFIQTHWDKYNPALPYVKYRFLMGMYEEGNKLARERWEKDGNYRHFLTARRCFVYPLYALLVDESNEVILRAYDGQLCQKYR